MRKIAKGAQKLS